MNACTVIILRNAKLCVARVCLVQMCCGAVVEQFGDNTFVARFQRCMLFPKCGRCAAEDNAYEYNTNKKQVNTTQQKPASRMQGT